MIDSLESRPGVAARLAAAVLAAWAGPLSAEWPPQSFEARYEVLMDGKPRMETRVRFQRDGSDWRLESDSKGTKGLARFLGVETSESATGCLVDGRVVPQTFSHATEVAVSKKHWSAEFDWDTGIARTTHEDGQSAVQLEPGTVDPLGLILQLQAFLEEGSHDWELPVLDETDIEYERYAAEGPQRLQTPMGCVETIEIRRIRDNEKRYSSMWLAPALNFVTVRMLHGKRDGHEFDMRITELELDGKRVDRRNDCD